MAMERPADGRSSAGMRRRSGTLMAASISSCLVVASLAFQSPSPLPTARTNSARPVRPTAILKDGHGASRSSLRMAAPIDEENATTPAKVSHHNSVPPILQKLSEKVGKIDESRMLSTPEYLNGEVPKLFSNLQYSTVQNGNETVTVVTARPDTHFISSSALLCGTALGCGLLTLPTAVSHAGYLPSIVATLVAWAYMTISALLTSELLINRCGETGRVRNVGLLELYESYLGDVGGKLAGVGFLVVSYLVVGVYLSEGGDQLLRLWDLSSNDGGMMGGLVAGGAGDTLSSVSVAIGDNHALVARAAFVAVMGAFLSMASKFNNVQKTMTNVFVPLTLLAFAAAVIIGLPTADFGQVIALENQHPEVVLDAFPLLFMGWTYHGVVPRVVYDLEGDKDKITKAIIGGSTTALVMYLVWNAVILGNALGGTGDGMAGDSMEVTAATVSSLVGTIQDSSAVVLGDMLSVPGGDINSAAWVPSLSLSALGFNPILQSSVAIVSELAVVTSLIGVVLGFVNEFNDAVGTLPSQSYGPKEDNKWKVALLTLLPPAVISVALGYGGPGNFDVDNYKVIDYTGIFGSSVLFLILPALMAWENRYGGSSEDEDRPQRPLTVRPMVPLGKIPLGSLYKAAGTLIVEQGLEKLGVLEYLREHVLDKFFSGGA